MNKAALKLSDLHVQPQAVGVSLDPQHSFADLGDYALAVYRQAIGEPDPRLEQEAANTKDPQDGARQGVLVPKDIAIAISQAAFRDDSFLGRCRLRSNRGQTAGYSQVVASVPVTADQLAAPGLLAAHLDENLPTALLNATNEAVLAGTGEGEPLGILNADCVISFPLLSSQATVSSNNIQTMFRSVIVSGSDVVWLVNPDFYPVAMVMKFEGGDAWRPSADCPNGLLLGRPIIVSDVCRPLGKRGSVVCANFAGYSVATRDGSLSFADSMHLSFDPETSAFQVAIEVEGRPVLPSPVRLANSAKERSHFVCHTDRG